MSPLKPENKDMIKTIQKRVDDKMNWLNMRANEYNK